MRRITSLIGPNAVVALVVVSGIVTYAGIGQARAEDCLAAPNVSSPPGQHWYYRSDRVNRRKCWYLHTPLRIAHQAHSAQAHSASVPANAKIEHPAPAAPVPAAAAPAAAEAAPMSAPMSAVAAAVPAAAPIPFATAPMSFAAAPMPAADPPVAAPAPAMDDSQSPPHVTVLAVKTIPVRPPGARTETQSRHGASGASISEASAGASTAAPESKSDPTMFFFLVFGLGITAFLMAIVIRRFAPWASWLWPVRTEPGIAWQQERPEYFGAEATPLGSRAGIGSRRIDRRMVKTDRYADESAEAEYELSVG